MDNKTIFTKTAKGVGEAVGKTRALSRDLRTVLKEVDGKASLDELLGKISTLSEAKIHAALSKLSTEDYIREFIPASLEADTLDFSTILPLPAKTPPRAPSQKTMINQALAKQLEARAKAEVEAYERMAREQEERERQAEEEHVRRKAEEKERRAEQQRAMKAAQESARLEAEERARQAKEEQARQKAEQQARREAEQAAQREAELKARQEAEERAKREAEEKARREAEELARKNAEAEARRLAEEQARIEAAEAQRKAEEQARQEAEEAARREAEPKARWAAGEEAKRRLEEMRRQQAEAEARQAKEEQARQEAEELAKKTLEEQAQRVAEEQARQAAAEQARLEAEEKARQKAEAESRRRAEEQARREAELKAKQEAEERAKREAEDKARREAEKLAIESAEAEARRLAEEQARIEAAEAQRKAEEQARQEAEEAARRAEEELARREKKAQAEKAAEELRRQQEELKARQEAEERAQRKADERAKREAEEKARREAEELALRNAEAEAQRLADEEIQREFEELARLQAEEVARQKAEVARRQMEEVAQRKAEAKAKKDKDDRARREREQAEARREAEIKAKQEIEQWQREADEERARKSANEAPVLQTKKQSEPDFAEPTGHDEDPQTEQYDQSEYEQDTYEPEEQGPEKKSIFGKREKAYRKPIKWGKPVSATLLLAALAGLGLIHAMEFDGQRALFEKTAAAQFQQPVKIGSVHLSLLPKPHWRLADVTVGAESQVTASQVKVTTDLADLFGDKVAFSAIELQSPVFKEQALEWLLFSRPQQRSFRADRISVFNAKVASDNISLPAFDASGTVGLSGSWTGITVDFIGKDAHVRLQPDGDAVQLELNAASFDVPFGSTLTLDGFTAKGKAYRNELVISDFTGGVYGGIVGGTAKLQWGPSWSLKGDVNAKLIDASHFAPELLQSGKLEGNASFILQSKHADTLFDVPRMEGLFAIQNGTLLGVDFARLLRSSNSAGKSSFAELTGAFVHENGKTQIQKLYVGAGLLSVRGNGDMDKDRNLNGRFTVELKSPTQQARSSLVVDGTLNAPRFIR